MSSLALMRWLEAAPERYDAGMRAITLGRVTAVHEAVARAAAPRAGCRILEVGCGTGAVTQLLLERGATVSALDQSAEMLDQARQRVAGETASRIEWLERTAAEIDSLPKAYDAVVFSLCLSEMSAEERHYVLSAANRQLRTAGTGGRVIVADEVHARGAARAIQWLLRAPQWLVGWLLAGSVSSSIPDLRAEIEAAGFVVTSERRWLGGTLALLVGEIRP